MTDRWREARCHLAGLESYSGNWQSRPWRQLAACGISGGWLARRRQRAVAKA